MTGAERRLGVWAEDPRSLAGAEAIETASRERRTVSGRLESLVGKSTEQRNPGSQMRAGVEYSVR